MKTQKVYWLHPTHKPEFLSEKASCNRTSTKDIVERFFNRDNAYSRRQRVCDLMSQLTDQELVEFTLPRVVDIVPPIDLFFFLERKLIHSLKLSPQLKTFLYLSPPPSSEDPQETLIDMAGPSEQLLLSMVTRKRGWLSWKGITHAHGF